MADSSSMARTRPLPWSSGASSEGVDGFSMSGGRRSVKVEPWPGLDLATRKPSWRRRMARAVARPSPWAFGLVVNEGSKMRGNNSGEIPGP